MHGALLRLRQAHMVELEIDGQKVEIVEGSMVMHAAQKLGLYVPHFCYHPKLSIAANCRMCLVEVEKAPKPMPACATPVSAGMKVYTKSEKAITAQQGVMEFLLINHPLDCPICDQGGECQLQDLAMGYGGSTSRYTEEKRVVFHKSMGPLISAQEMSRCIHCTRCVRFGQEVAGVMELGMSGRGEHSEIASFVGRSVDSELSGNMIDVCPVGALTSKPFRYSARTWELSRRKSVAAHDSLGSNIVVQTKNNKVMRVVPMENADINDCWISDRDRFSYEGLNSAERLTVPMIKEDGEWKQTDWQTALALAIELLKGVQQAHGAAQIGTLVSPNATLEEMALAARFTRAFGSENVDFRLRQSDANLDTQLTGAPWLGMPVAQLDTLDRVLLVGSFLRKDAPLMASRLRQAAKRGAKLVVLHAAADDLLMPVAAKLIAAPSLWETQLSQLFVAVLKAQDKPVPSALASLVPNDASLAAAKLLISGKSRAVLLGNAAMQHPDAAKLLRLSNAIASAIDGKCGVLGDAANCVGGYIANATPGKNGLTAGKMLSQPLRAYITVGVEPQLDCADAAAADKAMEQAQVVVALTAFDSQQLRDDAQVLLPITPFTETSGSFINTEGTLQSFNGVVRALGDARPAWKVLRVLGGLLQAPGFDATSSEDVLKEVIGSNGIAAKLSNLVSGEITAPLAVDAKGFERLAEVPIYFADAIVRRAPSLQETADARLPMARFSPASFAALGLAKGGKVRVSTNGASLTLSAAQDDGLADQVVRLPAAHASTLAAGAMFGRLQVEKA
jgi:NADH-quinone oxidoreductase subunit G